MPIGDTGEEWLVDAYGCDVSALKSEQTLRSLLGHVLEEVDLHPLGEGFWHSFPGEGGVTGLVPLQESHLTVHTYPEHRIAAFNLYCCRSACFWPWESRLQTLLGAERVSVRRFVRGLGLDAANPVVRE